MNRSRIFIYFFLFNCGHLFSSGLLHAQNIRAGIIGGINITQVDGDEVYGFHKYGFSAGTAAIFPLSDRFSISIENIYNQKGSLQKPRSNDSINGAYHLILNYVDVPIMIHYEDKQTMTFGT